MRWLVVPLLLSLAACAASDSDGQAPLPPGYVPPARAAPSPPVSPIPAAPADRCGAAELGWLVGRPRTEIPVPVDPSRRRVACTTCPITEDFRPDRLTILFDADTGLVTSVRCV